MKRALVVLLAAGCIDFEDAYQRRLNELDAGASAGGGSAGGSAGGATGGGSAGGTGGGTAGAGGSAGDGGPPRCLVADAGCSSGSVCVSRAFTAGGILVDAVVTDAGVRAFGRDQVTEGATQTSFSIVLGDDCSVTSSASPVALPRRAAGSSLSDWAVAAQTRVHVSRFSMSTDTCSLPNAASWHSAAQTSDGGSWFVGDNASVCRWDGVQFVGTDLTPVIPVGFRNLYSVWVAPDDTVWIGGHYGYLLKWVPGAALPEYVPLPNDEDIISGFATATQVWAGGKNGKLLSQLQDGGWQQDIVLASEWWNGIWGEGDEAWAVGTGGAFAHFRPTTGWLRDPNTGLPPTATLRSIRGGPGTLWVTGSHLDAGYLWQLKR